MQNGNPRDDMAEHLESAIVEQLPAMIGDPRELSIAQLNGLGHEKQPLLQVIRGNCIECVGGNQAEVRRCRMHWCAFWPYRMSTNPFAGPRSERQQAASQKAAALLRNARSLQGNTDEAPSDGEG